MMPLHHPSENPSLAFDRDIELIRYADELGYDEFFIGEHHSGGWERCLPEMALAKGRRMPIAFVSARQSSASVHHPFTLPSGWRFSIISRAVAPFSAGTLRPGDRKIFLASPPKSSTHDGRIGRHHRTLTGIARSIDVTDNTGSSSKCLQLRSYQRRACRSRSHPRKSHQSRARRK